MDDLDAHRDRLADPKTLPSWPALYHDQERCIQAMARQLQILTEAVIALQQAIQVLEEHYQTWQEEAEKDVPPWWRAD